MKAAMGAVKPMEETMRVLTQTELSRMTRTELMALLRRISAALPHLREGSPELRAAHSNLTEHPQGAEAAADAGAATVVSHGIA